MERTICLGYSGYNPSVWKDVTPGMVYVDVGAWQGETMKRTAAMYPDLTMVGIEPNPNHFDKLKQVAVKAFVVCKACWSVPGTAKLYMTEDSANRGCSLFMRSDSIADRVLMVETDTLDNILDELGVEDVHLLKIDTEGAEHMVLRGFTKYHKGTQFHIETHSNLDSVLYELLRKSPEELKIGIGAKDDPGGGKSSVIYGRF